MFSPQYTITNQILKYAGRIESAKSVIERAPLVPSFERKFQKETLVRTAHYGTKIEGNRLSHRDAKRVIEGVGVGGNVAARDVQEVINYRQIVNIIDKLSKKQRVNNGLREFDLLKIHSTITEKLVPNEELGRYRKVTVTLRNDKTGRVSFSPPPFGVVPGQVKNLFSWLAKRESINLHPVLRSGIVLAEVARIHPFTEGNGRTARALATLSLYLDGYNIKKFFCLDEYYDRNIKDYYKAIQSYKTLADDLTLWLEFFVEGLAVELEYIEDKVVSLSRNFKIKDSVGQVVLSERQEEIVEFLQDYGQFKNSDFEKLFPNLSEDTVLRELKDLTKKKVIVKKGKTKGSYYELR